ncbi:hypothetical protein T06_7766, partial [Trichinella sp. T6]
MTKVIESLCLTRKASYNMNTFQEVDEPCSSRGAIAMPRIVHDVQKDLVTHWPLSFVYCRKCNASLCMNKARNRFLLFHAKNSFNHFHTTYSQETKVGYPEK